jgi:murein DD-endopeptidase MepM/ murein hydrolase activator NlpD
VLATSLLPAPALANADGGTAAPTHSEQAGGGSGYRTTAPAPPERRPAADEPKRTAAKAKRARRGSVLTSFSLRRPNLYLGGYASRLSFEFSGRRAVKTRLRVLNAADRSVVAVFPLGDLAPRVPHVVTFTGSETGAPLPEGRYLLHIAGRGLRRGAVASSTAEVSFSHHRFPLVGDFDWGNEGSRFGAGRKGHIHQGQDLSAVEGTPIVAPRGGTVEAVQYQAGGAGHYIVLDVPEENRDYVFMHLRTGSTVVEEGQAVRTGQRLAEVGNTGGSTGAHLHFEIWVGGWWNGGAPIDPLPELQLWAGVEPTVTPP